MKREFILFIISLITANSFSQDTLKFRKKKWANIGLGVTSNKLLNAGVDYNNIFLKNGCYHIGADFSSGFWGVPSLNVINPGIGMAFINEGILTAVIVGPAIMWGKVYDNRLNALKSFITIGGSINIHLAVKPLKDLGVGIVLFTNINVYQSTTGFRVVLHLSSKPE